MTRGARIVVARLDPAARATCTSALERGGHHVTAVAPAELPDAVDRDHPDVVVCDASSIDQPPVRNALVLTDTQNAPLLLAVVPNRAQGILALEAGADAFIVAPFGLHDLEVHTAALLRRRPVASRPRRVGAIVIDPDARRIQVDEQDIALTRKEFEILSVLAASAGVVISKRALLERVWGYEAYDENLVEVHVSSLRRRLPPAAAAMVKTVRGTGYVLRDLAQGRPA